MLGVNEYFGAHSEHCGFEAVILREIRCGQLVKNLVDFV